MKQKDKELLLRDISARLPYGVKVNTNRGPELMEGLWPFGFYDIKIEGNFDWSYLDFKPYLRPMSSMTKEERNEYKHLVAFSGSPNGAANFVDWLNKKMFAYRTIDGKDMFELGLALEAPKGMYEKAW